MKKIEAIIKPFKLGDVKNALLHIGVHGLTVYDVNGFGKQRGHVELGQRMDLSADFVPKIKLDLWITDDQEEKVVAVLLDAANTGEVGDGKIFVSSVGNAFRIRTREQGEQALK